MSASEVQMFQEFSNNTARPRRAARSFEDAVAAQRVYDPPPQRFAPPTTQHSGIPPRGPSRPRGAPVPGNRGGGVRPQTPPTLSPPGSPGSVGSPGSNGPSGPRGPPRASVRPVTPPLTPQTERFEKQATLMELDRLRQSGAGTTRTWNMEDNLDDMKIEARKLTANAEEAQMVNLMRDFLRLSFTGLEFLNRRIRLLHLDGWADEAGKDMGRYDNTLRSLYRKYGRHSAASPEVELLMGIGASVMMHHGKQVIAPTTRRAPADATATPGDRKAPPASVPKDVPFSMPSSRKPSHVDSDDEEAPPPSVVGVSFD